MDNISKEDIYKIANDLTIGLTDAQVEQILEEYSSAQVDAPEDNWSEVVENLIYNLKNV